MKFGFVITLLGLMLLGCGCAADYPVGGTITETNTNTSSETAKTNAPEVSAAPQEGNMQINNEPAKSAKPTKKTAQGKLPKLADPIMKIYKAQRTLQLWDKDKLISEYPIALGSVPVGHKKAEGDGKTPEGSYFLCVKNDKSSYYKSLGVSYPNTQDAQEAYVDRRITRAEHDGIAQAIKDGKRPPWNTPLGGAIMIHGNGSGSDWTVGCIAVENDVMDALWQVCDIGTGIIIYP